MSDDEYDKYNLSLDIEDLPYITSLPPSPPTTGHPSQETQTSITEEELQVQQQEDSQDSQSSDADVFYTAPSTQILDGHQSDSYSDYDFRDFTAEDFASIDAAVAAVEESSTSAAERSRNGGPAVSVVLEEASKSLSSMGPPVASLSGSKSFEKSAPPVRKTKESSPYERYRSWKGALSVTDLTSPSWCEVQFDYGLRQKRTKKLEDRPAEFKTATGKTIVVDQTVAVVNDRVAQRGRSVHKVLERELHPEVVQVETTTEEERWALRLVNMIVSMQSLLNTGRCREMHVFGILNSQVVIGIIDEVERKAIPITPQGTPRISRKRSPSKSSAPSTPTKHKSKRARTLSPAQLPLTNFFPSTPSRTESQTTVSSSPPREDKCIQVSSPPHMTGIVLTPSPAEPPPPPMPHFKLHLSDTKTRRNASLPLPVDMFSARMQLMLYHRLLSNLLTSPSESEDALDFQLLWTRMGLDHRRRFSKTFQDAAGLVLLSGGGEESSFALNCLDDLTAAWRNVVEMLHLSGVDDTLTVVYRTQPSKPKKKGKRRRGCSPVNEVLSQESEDIVQAVIASLQEEHVAPCNREMVESRFKTLLSEVTHPGVPTMSADTELLADSSVDAQLQWAIEQSLLKQVRRRPDIKGLIASGGVVSDPPSPKTVALAYEETETREDDDVSDEPIESTIIGTKTFQMDDRTLNSYLRSVLDWWYGRRPPKGVDLHLTRRCLSCEYQEGCEWRERKAAEYREGKGNR
ncbi:exonuclease V a 5' deoxyribonuclease-domain-containing protein [Cristinia sonorae]|uniref:Exonuclease V a 5' deoxyribonuclease-domain-containing protein n=1 Tax=Cristinia sonorae TaxID=1940300 RepID=A0A8K0ULP8_9AGAR|nr:exonuclease V a 5' deoxyribonuclease-domain-containing protein [Cristinia sonorae]